GQATSTSSDFAAGTWNGGTTPSMSGQYDLISNYTPGDGNLAFSGNNLTTGAPPLASGGLASNGGPTQTIALTWSLLGVSVEGITTDQRGITRPATPDIGSYQMVGPSVTSVSPSSGPSTGGTPVTITGTNLADATAVD